MVCRIRDSVAIRELHLKKNVYLQFTQVNALKNVAKMTERGGRKRTDQFSRQCLDASGT